MNFSGLSVMPCRPQMSSHCAAWKNFPQSQAILDFPTPRNITDVRSWFGLVNQVFYAFSMAEKMLPFRQLLKPETPFCWDEHLNRLFEESKAAIISEIESLTKKCLATDWSKTSIGFWLFQKIVSAQEVHLVNKTKP
jgi:hypothetical protein